MDVWFEMYWVLSYLGVMLITDYSEYLVEHQESVYRMTMLGEERNRLNTPDDQRGPLTGTKCVIWGRSLNAESGDWVRYVPLSCLRHLFQVISCLPAATLERVQEGVGEE